MLSPHSIDPVDIIIPVATFITITVVVIIIIIIVITISQSINLIITIHVTHGVAT